MLEVTDVGIREYKKGSMLGFVTVELNGCLEIKGFKLFVGKEGREFDIGLPSEKDKNGKKDDKGGDKYWPLIYIKLKTEEGKALMDSIKEKVIARYKSGGGEATTNAGPPSNAGGDNWPDQGADEIPF